MERLVLTSIAAFFGAMGFGILFRVPRSHLIPAGFAGMISWVGYAGALASGMGRFAAGFIGAAVASAWCEWGARRLRVPVTLLVVPAIIPLVPGFDAYWAMLKLLHGDNEQGIATAVEAILVALSIAAGVVTAATFFRMRRVCTKIGGNAGSEPGLPVHENHPENNNRPSRT